MIYESLKSGHSESASIDVTGGTALIGLSVATSIDALGVGLSLGFLRSGVLVAAVVVGAVAFLVTGAGFSFGRRIGASLGRWADFIGGVVLIGIGLRILLTHTL